MIMSPKTVIGHYVAVHQPSGHVRFDVITVGRLQINRAAYPSIHSLEDLIHNWNCYRENPEVWKYILL